MIRIIDTKAEPMNTYATPQKVVITVVTNAATVWVGTSKYQLEHNLNGNQQGTPVTQAGGTVALDLVGEVWWLGSAAGVHVDVLEARVL